METLVARSIFSPATGFIHRGGFEWTCNPYVGCTFGCTYCYAMFLPQNRRPRELWGRWIQAKANAIELAERHGPRLAGQAVYLSSVTDPYLPAEASLRLTRGILHALVQHQPRLLVQTRGPLVTRDIDILRRFHAVRVNVSISTDSERIRSLFEPKAPPLEKRWEALALLRAAGLPIGICVTPMLPLEDPLKFAERLCRFNPEVLVIQGFHESKGAFGADTGRKARELLQRLNWCESTYEHLRTLLSARRQVYEGEAGFFPPAAPASSLDANFQPACACT